MRCHSQNMECLPHTTDLPALNYFELADVVPVLTTPDIDLEALDQALTYNFKFTFKLTFNFNLGSHGKSDSQL